LARTVGGASSGGTIGDAGVEVAGVLLSASSGAAGSLVLSGARRTAVGGNPALIVCRCVGQFRDEVELLQALAVQQPRNFQLSQTALESQGRRSH